MAIAPHDKTKQFPTHINISAEPRAHLVELLNAHLADTLDLMTQVKQAHWNVKGKEFYQLHLLFDEIAEELEGYMDELAERATSLGGYATGTVRMAAEHSALPEYPTDAVEGPEHVAALVERFGLYTSRIRAGIEETAALGDQATADLYTEIARGADKRLWFLEAHLQAAE